MGFESKEKAPVATESELLEFANKLRVAGGANVLEALLPSRPNDPAECLIANALNFSCSVAPSGYLNHNTGERQWLMYLPNNMERDRAQQIADAVDCELIIAYPDSDLENFAVKLPAYIGNAAAAFDYRLRFTNYVKPVRDYRLEVDHA